MPSRQAPPVSTGRPEATTATLDLETVTCAACGSDRQERARVRVPRDDSARDLGLPQSRSQWVVCADCALVYQSPRPGPESVARLYEGGAYHVTRGGIPEHYVQYSLRRSVDALDWALERLPATGRALDIGCGIGGALVKLRNEGWDVSGVEPDGTMAEVARSRFGLDAIDGFFDETTFAGASFDLAYSCHVWEHLADPLATTKAAHSVLAPTSGHLMIVVPTFRRPRTRASACFTAPHTYMFTEVSLGNIVDAAGFDVIDHRFHGGADTELWLLTRARPHDLHATVEVRREDRRQIQRELARARLGVPLGLPGRASRSCSDAASRSGRLRPPLPAAGSAPTSLKPCRRLARGRRQGSRRRAYVRGWERASARTSSRSPTSGYDV